MPCRIALAELPGGRCAGEPTHPVRGGLEPPYTGRVTDDQSTLSPTPQTHPRPTRFGASPPGRAPPRRPWSTCIGPRKPAARNRPPCRAPAPCPTPASRPRPQKDKDPLHLPGRQSDSPTAPWRGDHRPHHHWRVPRHRGPNAERLGHPPATVRLHLSSYRGWRWAVTLSRDVPRSRTSATVCEMELLPGEEALLAPAW